MARIATLRGYDPVLSEISLGYSNSTYIANEVFPEVLVTASAGKYREFSQSLFDDDGDDARALGADSNVIEMDDSSLLPWALQERDLATPLDYQEKDEPSDINIEVTRTYELTQKQQLKREVRVATLVQTSGNYTNGNTSTPGVKWDDPSSTPILDLQTAGEVIRANATVVPNTLFLGATTRNALANHPDFIGRLSNTKTAVLDNALIAEIVGVERVVVGNAIRRVNGAKQDVWGDNAILAYVAPGRRDQRSVRTPGFGYTLVKRGWKPVDMYERPGSGGKVQMIRVTTKELQLFLGNIAGYLLTNTVT